MCTHTVPIGVAHTLLPHHRLYKVTQVPVFLTLLWMLVKLPGEVLVDM